MLNDQLFIQLFLRLLKFGALLCQLSKVGGRLIIASDGVWDALSSEKAAKCCKGLPAELAARQVVKVWLSSISLALFTTFLSIPSFCYFSNFTSSSLKRVILQAIRAVKWLIYLIVLSLRVSKGFWATNKTSGIYIWEIQENLGIF